MLYARLVSAPSWPSLSVSFGNRSANLVVDVIGVCLQGGVGTGHALRLPRVPDPHGRGFVLQWLAALEEDQVPADSENFARDDLRLQDDPGLSGRSSLAEGARRLCAGRARPEPCGLPDVDNAPVRAEDIKTYVQQRYIVRIRSDIETYEAKVNDMARANAAFAGVPQVVSTQLRA